MTSILSNTSLGAEVVPSNRSKSAASLRQSFEDAGILFVERSIIKIAKRIGRGGQGTIYEASVSWHVSKVTKMAAKKFSSKFGMSQGQYPLEL